MKKCLALLLILFATGLPVLGQEEVGKEISTTTTSTEDISLLGEKRAGEGTFLMSLLGGEENCETIICDDFNDYINGDLNGQGGWSGSTAFDIEDITTYEGEKAVEIITTATGGNRIIHIEGTEYAEGSIAWYWRRTSNNNGGAYVMLTESGTGNWKVFVAMENTGQIVHYYNGGSDNVGAYSINDWHFLEAEWLNDGTARVRIDEGEWSAWRDAFGDWTNLDGIDLIAGNTSPNATTYWDYIGVWEEPQEIYQLVENPEYPEREFYLEKTISYSDLFLVFILILALLWVISIQVFDYFWKK